MLLLMPHHSLPKGITWVGHLAGNVSNDSWGAIKKDTIILLCGSVRIISARVYCNACHAIVYSLHSHIRNRYHKTMLIQATLIITVCMPY